MKVLPDVDSVDSIAMYGIAGTMGRGWAITALLAGFKVLGYDICSKEDFRNAVAYIHKQLEKAQKKGKTPEGFDVVQAMEKLSVFHIEGAFIEACKKIPIFLEVIPEDLALKIGEFERICPQLSENTDVWTNTSCLHVEKLARASGRPGIFIGTHGMNPVNITRLVEVVKHDLLNPGVLEWTIAVLRKIGKDSFVAKNVPGFIINKLFIPWAMDAIGILERAEADVATVDKGINGSLGHPQAVFKLLDRIGLDIMVAVGHELYQSTQDVRHYPRVLLQEMVVAGNLGFKSGKGFYDWREDPRNPRPLSSEELTRVFNLKAQS